MLNKKNWLIVKFVFIVSFAILGIVYPAADDFHTWLRVGMIFFFTLSFIADFINYKKSK